MVAVAVILGLVAFVVGILYFIAATGGAWLERAREAATALGCADLPSVNKTLTEEFEVHQWTCQGVAMTLQAGSQMRDAPPGSQAPGVIIMSALIVAELPKPLPFEFSIGNPRLPSGPVISTGDAEFDEELAVRASDEAAARRLLASPELRAELRSFYQSSRSLPTVMGSVSETEVRIQTFDRKHIRELCERAAALALTLSGRATA